MPSPHRVPTRQDVASRAGVSGATVSRVYNHPELVDEATVAKVRRAAQDLGFVPDRHASALRRKGSSTLLFVEIEEGPSLGWPSQRAYQGLYGEIVRAVLHTVQGSPFYLKLVSLRSASEIPQLEAAGDFGGILGFDVTDSAIATSLAALGRPVVCCHHGDHLKGVSTVTSNNFAGGALQAQSLRERGHTKVAYVTGQAVQNRSHEQRRDGFASVLVPTVHLDDCLGWEGGLEAGRRLAPALKSGQLTAVACVNDLTALGLREALRTALPSGQDVPLVGYDNLLLTGLVGRGLLTIEARLPEVYTRAIQLLERLVTSPGDEVHEQLDPVITTAN